MIGMLAGLASSIAGAGVSTAISNANAERANKVQRDMQRDSMMYNKFQSDLAYERGTLASRIRQMRDAGFSPSLALDFSQQLSPATSSVPSAHQANQPNIDFTPFTSAVSEFENREFQGDLQRAQVLSTLSQANLSDAQKDLVNGQLLDLIDQRKYRHLDYEDRHVTALKANELVDAQIKDMTDKLQLEKDRLEHQKSDDAEKNRIQEKIGTLNNDIKTFEYFFKMVQDFLNTGSGKKTVEEAKKVYKKLVNAPETFKKKIKDVYGSYEKWVDDVMNDYVGFSWKEGFYRYDRRTGERK